MFQEIVSILKSRAFDETSSRKHDIPYRILAVLVSGEGIFRILKAFFGLSSFTRIDTTRRDGLSAALYD